ncbi:MAG: glycoside hydrolase family 13 protein [Candidatus Marinimicrobia bacterium]|nr:glycoside hydrolase family 13 protein [Candidatus Neomarinimicrobiota bacterium]
MLDSNNQAHLSIRTFAGLLLVLVLWNCAAQTTQTIIKSETLTNYKVPEWSKEAIWYQIFPDRFRNGDTENDPDVKSLSGTWPYANPEGWQVSPWGSDWYELQPWEQKTGENFWYNSQLRRYGGDIQGILDELDYIDSLGVTAVYFNPLFESPSLHKYGCSAWHHIDNNFGPDPAGDEKLWAQENPNDPSTWQWTSADSLFLKLIDELHARDMRIIIDGVFNHTGIPFWALNDVRKNGPQSEYANWFSILSYDDPDTPEDEFDWQGWYGVKDLPELAEDDHGPVQAVRNHIHDVVKRWMDPNGDGDPSDGIDGWRLDVAEMVSKDFWRDFRVWTRDVNPESYLVGEVWWEDFGKDQMFNAAPWLQGDIFDAVMNYRFGDALLRGIVDQKRQVTPGQMDSLLSIVRDNYPLQNQYALMSMFNSHDTERLSSMVSNPDRTIDHHAGSRDHRQFFLGKPNESQRALQRTLLLFQFSYVGAPLIYYGEEVGMWGADDPDCRKPMLWDDIEYKTEVSHPYGEPFGPYEVRRNEDLYAYYRSLIDMRKYEPALQTGSYQTLEAEDKGHFAFQRVLGPDTLMTVINTGAKDWAIEERLFGSEGSAAWTLLLDSNLSDNTDVAPHSGRVYKRIIN